MLEQPPSPGEWVLLHMGFIVSVVDEAEATRAMDGLELMGRARDDRGPDNPVTAHTARPVRS